MQYSESPRNPSTRVPGDFLSHKPGACVGLQVPKNLVVELFPFCDACLFISLYFSSHPIKLSLFYSFRYSSRAVCRVVRKAHPCRRS